jgi:hypothetical protein
MTPTRKTLGLLGVTEKCKKKKKPYGQEIGKRV